MRHSNDATQRGGPGRVTNEVNKPGAIQGLDKYWSQWIHLLLNGVFIKEIQRQKPCLEKNIQEIPGSPEKLSESESG